MSDFRSLREALAYVHAADYSTADLANLVVRGELKICIYVDGWFPDPLPDDSDDCVAEKFHFEGYITPADNKLVQFLSHPTLHQTVYLSEVYFVENTSKLLATDSQGFKLTSKKTYGVSEITNSAIFVEGRGFEFSNEDSSLDFAKLKKLLPEIKMPVKLTSANNENQKMNVSPEVPQQKSNAPRKISEDENLVIIGAIIDLLFNEKAIVRTQDELVQKLLEKHYPNTKYITDSTLKKNFAAANTKFEEMKNNK